MKKLILAAFALTAAGSVFAQGTLALTFKYASGNLQTIHIWGPSSTAPTLSLVGLGANDLPTSGAVPFATDGMALVGNGQTAVGNGQFLMGYATTLFSLLGVDAPTTALMPVSSLVPVGQTSTFRSGTSIGSVASVTDTLSISPGYSGPGNPITSGGGFASFEIVMWDDASGLYSNWTLASAAWLSGKIAGYESTEFQVSAIGGGLNLPPYLNNMTSFQSANLYYVPEPSMFALAGLGAATLLIFRRRK